MQKNTKKKNDKIILPSFPVIFYNITTHETIL